MTTTYYRNVVMGNLFGTQTSPGLPAAYYLGLSSTEPQRNGEGVTEPNTIHAYSRIQITNWSTPTDGVVSNTGPVSFAKSTDDWGDIGYFFLADAATGGNICYADELDSVRHVDEGTVLTFEAGGLKVTLTDLVTA